MDKMGMRLANLVGRTIRYTGLKTLHSLFLRLTSHIPPRRVRPLSPRRYLEHGLRLRDLRAVHGAAGAAHAHELRRGRTAIQPAQHHRIVSRLQVVRVQDEGKLPA